jgi:hypothetical protein
VSAIRELLHWLVDHAEARDEDRDTARQLVDQAHPGEDTQQGPGGVQDAPERGPEPGEGGSQA